MEYQNILDELRYCYILDIVWRENPHQTVRLMNQDKAGAFFLYLAQGDFNIPNYIKFGDSIVLTKEVFDALGLEDYSYRIVSEKKHPKDWSTTVKFEVFKENNDVSTI